MQKRLILQRLQEKGGSITSFEAINDFGATRLAAVIFKLKKEGHIIKDEWITVRNRYQELTDVKRYFMTKV